MPNQDFFLRVWYFELPQYPAHYSLVSQVRSCALHWECSGTQYTCTADHWSYPQPHLSSAGGALTAGCKGHITWIKIISDNFGNSILHRSNYYFIIILQQSCRFTQVGSQCIVLLWMLLVIGLSNISNLPDDICLKVEHFEKKMVLKMSTVRWCHHVVPSCKKGHWPKTITKNKLYQIIPG